MPVGCRSLDRDGFYGASPLQKDHSSVNRLIDFMLTVIQTAAKPERTASDAILVKLDGARCIFLCINSIVQVPTSRKYDVVVMDDADAIRSSLGDFTMNDRYPDVIMGLRRLVGQVGLIIHAQSELREDVVTWEAHRRYEAAGTDTEVRCPREVSTLAVSCSLSTMAAASRDCCKNCRRSPALSSYHCACALNETKVSPDIHWAMSTSITIERPYLP